MGIRIDKAQACSLLNREMGKLASMADQCEVQEGQLRGFSMYDMSGKSASAATELIRAQAASAGALKNFCMSLKNAHQTNRGLVEALPTTSGNVLDTNEAQERIDKAKSEIAWYRQTLQNELDNIARQKQLAQSSQNVGGYAGSSESEVRGAYESLINAGEVIVRTNEEILRKAQEYDRQSKQVYECVNTSFVVGMSKSAASLGSSGTLGSTAWVNACLNGAQNLKTTLEAQSAKAVGVGKAGKNAIEKNSTEKGSVGGGLSLSLLSLSGKSKRDGVEQEGRASFYNLKAGSENSFEFTSKTKDGKTERDVSVGKEAKVEGSLVNVGYSRQGEIGGVPYEVSAEAKVGEFSARGGVSGGLYDEDGNFSPHAEVGGSIEGSVLSGNTKLKVGPEFLNTEVEASGKVLTGKAEAELTFGKDGINAAVGAEAYLAQGEIKGTVDLFGIKVTTVAEGKVGGAGAVAEFHADGRAADINWGLGMGVGVGTRTHIDFSGLCDFLGIPD